MTERPDTESKAWNAFRSSQQEARADALLDLYINLESLDSEEAISAGYAALESLLLESRFEQAAFIARSLGTELANLERFDDAVEVVDKVLDSSLWLSDFEVGMLYYVNGRNYIGQKELATAEVVLERCVGILETENERFAGFAYKELAEVRVQLNDHEGAIRAFSASISILEGCAEAGSVGHAKRRLGEVLLSQKQFLMAEKYLKDAASISSFAEWYEDKYSSHLSLGNLMIEQEDFEQAEALLTPLVSLKSESRFIPIAAQASFSLQKLKVLNGESKCSESEIESLKAVLSAAALFDLADSVDDLAALVPSAQTESKRNSPLS